MSQNITYQINDRPEPDSICNLREAVGYDRNEKEYPTALDRYDVTVSAYNKNGSLVGWCAAVSDGVRHGFLVDLIVHPESQRRGIGRSLVQHAIEFLLRSGISVIHADFNDENAAFYEKCGFRIGVGGICEKRK